MGGNKLVDVEDFLMNDMCGFKRDDVEGIEFGGKEFDDMENTGNKGASSINKRGTTKLKQWKRRAREGFLNSGVGDIEYVSQSKKKISYGVNKGVDGDVQEKGSERGDKGSRQTRS